MRNHLAGSVLALLITTLMTISCGSSSSPTTPAAGGGGGGGGADVVITINGQSGNMSFSPAAATMRAGQTVAWRNADNLTHTAFADGGAFDTRSIGGGATSAPVMLSTPGTFPYHCSIHPTMVGTLTVQ